MTGSSRPAAQGGWPSTRAGHTLGPVAALVFNACVWGVSWWPFRWLQQHGLHPLWATVIIYAVAVALITAWRPGAWGLLLRTPALWALMLASGATNASFNTAVTLGDVVRVVLLSYLMPVWAVFLSRLLLSERLTLLAGVRVVMALSGAAIVLWPEGAGWPFPQTAAEWLGVLAGFSFALNNVLLRREAHRPDTARALAMFAGGLVVSLGAALWLGLQGGVPWPPPLSTAWVSGMLVMALIFLSSNLALQYGSARLPANATAVVMVSEVLFASASAVALGAGTMSWGLAGGAALILAASLMAAWRR